ncbi:MAG: hypothetical protein JSU72_20585, partial [Deltaproteobacteria bacterium]
YSFYAYFRPSPSQSYSVFSHSGHNSFTGMPEKTASIGFNASTMFRNALRFGFSFQSYNIVNKKLPYRDFLFTTLDLTLPNRHLISLKGRYLRFDDLDRDEHSFFVAYTIPFGIPAMKKTSLGVLKGRIVDADHASTPPMPNVVVSAGEMTAVTDQNGEYIFPMMNPGNYCLKVDQRTVGMKRTTSKPPPLSVEVIGGKTVHQEIGISTTCHITGTVVLLAADPSRTSAERLTTQENGFYIAGNGESHSAPLTRDDLIEVGGLDNILVQISNGEEVFSVRTDGKGRFSFQGIRPGKWKLTVYDQGLPQNHQLEQANFSISLEQGTSETITVNVLPRIRSVRMLNGVGSSRGQ